MTTHRNAYLALILTILIWGSTFLITKVLLNEIAPLQMTFLRFAIAFVALLIPALRQGFHLKDIFKPRFLLYGLTGTALYYAFQNVGMELTSVTDTALILSIGPVITVVMAVIFLHEKLTRWQILGFGLVTCGMVLVSLVSTASSAESPNPILGNLLIFGSTLAWGVYTVQGRKMVDAYPAMVMAMASTGGGLVYLTPLAVGEVAVKGLPHLSGLGWVEIIYLGLAASALTLFLWNYALHYLSASVASPFLNMVPVIGVASSYLLGERPAALQLVGGGLAIAGVLLSSLMSGQAQRRSDAALIEGAGAVSSEAGVHES